MAYTTIERSFWTDPLIQCLSIKERYLYLYFLTNHHAHYSGVYYLPYTYIIEESGVNKADINKCIKKLSKKIRYDNDTNVIWVINMFKYQNSKGGNPKVIYSGIEKHFKGLHSDELIREFIVKYQEFIPTLRQGWFKDASRLRQPIGTDTVTDVDTGTVSDNGTDTGENPKPKQKEISLPEDFSISENMKKWGIKNNYDPEQYFEPFLEWASSKSRKYLSWDSVFQRYIREDWGKVRLGKPQREQWEIDEDKRLEELENEKLTSAL